MRNLRQLVRFGFGVQALAMPATVFLAFPHAGEAVFLLPFLNSLPAVAWWMLRKDGPPARRWAIAASLLNLILLAAGIAALAGTGDLRIALLYLSCGINGVLGLIAFWHAEGSAEGPIGDGANRLKDYLGHGLTIGVVAIASLLWMHWAGFHRLPVPELIPFLAQMEIALLVAVVAHELGHVAAEWVCGDNLRAFEAGPLAWVLHNDLWGFEQKTYSGPAPDLRRMRSAKAFGLIGGPMGSLLTGSICVAAALAAPGRPWQVLWPMLAMLAAFSSAAFVVNLVPLKPEGMYSDGARFFEIATNGAWAQIQFAFVKVAASLVSPVRPRDFDVAAINRAADSLPFGERGLLLQLFACLYYLDSGKIQAALASMQAAEVLYEDSIFEKPQGICAEFVFVNAFYKRDLHAAEQWWRHIEAMSPAEHNADYWRAQAALQSLKGDRDQAWEAWVRGNAIALRLPATGACDFTRTCFAKLRESLNAPAEAAPPSVESLTALAAVCETAHAAVEA